MTKQQRTTSMRIRTSVTTFTSLILCTIYHHHLSDISSLFPRHYGFSLRRIIGFALHRATGLGQAFHFGEISMADWAETPIIELY
jgi:hypothetical protein